MADYDSMSLVELSAEVQSTLCDMEIVGNEDGAYDKHLFNLRATIARKEQEMKK